MDATETAPGRKLGYRDIVAALLADIGAGTWQPGAALPTEAALMQRFGAGRNTVREAVRQLEELGYVQRRRGARTVLASANPEGSFINSVRSIEQLLHYARLTRSQLRASETLRADAALAQRLDVRPGSDWVRIGILRSRDAASRPICYSEIYIEPRFADVLPHVEGELTVYALIERHHNLVCRRVEQDIEAGAADAHIASRLGVPEGSPILLVRTKFFSEGGHLFEVGLGHFPAGRYRVRMSLERRGR